MPFVRIGINSQVEPFGKKIEDQNGIRYEGIDYTIAMLIAEGLQVELEEYEVIDLSDREEVLINGTVDLVVALYSITKEREEKIDFSVPYCSTGIGIAVKKGDDRFASLDDLPKARIGVLRDSTALDFVQKRFPPQQIIRTDRQAELYQLIGEGKADAIADDRPLLEYRKRTLDQSNEPEDEKYQIQLIPGLLTFDQYGVGVQQGNDALRAEVNRILTRNLTPDRNGLSKLDRVFQLQNVTRTPKIRSYQDIMDSGELIVGLNPNTEPFCFLDQNGLYSGIDYEIAKQISGRLGLELRPLALAGAFQREEAIRSGAVDMVAAIYSITPEREKKIDFSIPYCQTAAGIATLAGNAKIQKLTDLRDASVGVKSKTTAVSMLEKRGIEKGVVEFPTQDDLYIALDSGQVEAIVSDGPLLEYQQREKGRNIKVLGDGLDVDKYGIGVRDGNTELLDRVDETLQEYLVRRPVDGLSVIDDIVIDYKVTRTVTVDSLDPGSNIDVISKQRMKIEELEQKLYALETQMKGSQADPAMVSELEQLRQIQERLIGDADLDALQGRMTDVVKALSAGQTLGRSHVEGEPEDGLVVIDLLDTPEPADIQIHNEVSQQRIVVGAHLLFESGAVTPSESGTELLTKIAKILHSRASVLREIQIQGHADKVGEEMDNLNLAFERSISVYEIFGKNGFNSQEPLMSATSFGENKPAATTVPGDPESRNRRIEIVLKHTR